MKKIYFLIGLAFSVYITDTQQCSVLSAFCFPLLDTSCHCNPAEQLPISTYSIRHTCYYSNCQQKCLLSFHSRFTGRLQMSPPQP